MSMALWLLMVVGLGCLLRATSDPIPLHNAMPSWVASANAPVPLPVVDSPSANVTAPPSVYNVPSANVTASHNDSAETFEDVEGNLVVEGDMIVAVDRNAVNAVWSDAIVPYEISPELGGRSAEIQEAFRMISASTCIRFVVYTNEYNYLTIKEGTGCASSVGVSGGQQSVYFSASCTVGNLAHELIHALGLYHEHTRSDRDAYITVNWNNIIPSKKGNFQVKSGNSLNQPYDYESIMHYGTSYFSVDGSPTIVANSPMDIGQRTHLSRLDIAKLRALYRC